MLTPMIPTVVSSWLDVLWVVDHSWYTQKTVECEKPSSFCRSWHKPVRRSPSTIPCSKALKHIVLPIHPLNDTHTQSVSPSLTCLLPFKKHSSTESVQWMQPWSHTSTVHFHSSHMQTAHCFYNSFLHLSTLSPPRTFSLHLWTSVQNTSAVCDQAKKPFQAKP
jgi:hypothetical protein